MPSVSLQSFQSLTLNQQALRLVLMHAVMHAPIVGARMVHSMINSSTPYCLATSTIKDAM
jgi:hypothetical protein